MGKIIWTAVKILLVLALLAAIGVGLYFLCLHLGWPTWMAAVILLSLLAVITGALFIRKLINRRRQEGFIKQVVEQDEAGLRSGPVFESRQTLDLAQRWEEAVDTLKRSHLKKLGNPLYVLPHYLVIGGPGTGKTAAIRGSRLPSAFPDLGHPAGDVATRNCDWWFFEKAIVLDTTGRYCQGPGAPREEWKKFLTLLSNYRRKEPVNGLVVTVPADKLGHRNTDEMEMYGRNLRQVIDQLMRVLGAKFPVYVLVTRLDQVHGMTAFGGLLSWKALKQAMGELNHKLERDAPLFAGQAVDAVAKRLKELRLLLLARQEPVPPEALLFPEEFAELKNGLQAFMRGAFQENPYQEAPTLRGVFFGSAEQDGVTKSAALAQSEVAAEAVVEKGDRSYFLHDFWNEVLPRDRYLVTPIREFIRWRRSTRDLGLIATAALVVFISGLFAASALKNYNAIESFKVKFVEPPALSGRATEDMILVDSFRKEIIGLEKSNRNWWLPRMGFNQSREEEERLKAIYIRLVHESLLDRVDAEMEARISEFDATTPDVVLGDYISHLVHRLNIIKARLAGLSIEEQKKLPQPSGAVALLIDKTMLPTVAGLYNDLYLYELNWNPDQAGLSRKKDQLEFWLVRLLQLKGDNLEWLVAWADKEPGLVPVTMSQFWEDKIDTDHGPRVSPAFTLAGMARIEEFIARVEKALDDPAVVKERKELFAGWYGRQYAGAWANFAGDFLDDEDRLRQLQENAAARSRSQWQALAIKMTTFDNPYYNFMVRASDELAHLKGSEAAGSWLKLMVDFKAMRSQVESQGFVQQAASMAGSVKQVAENTIMENPTAPKRELDVHMKAVKELQVLQKSLTDIAASLDSPEHSLQASVALFSGSSNPSLANSPFSEGYTSIERTRALLGSPGANEELFWQLLRGPLDHLLFYTTHQAACALQKTWEEKVLAEIQGVPDASMQAALFGENGVVWKFTKGPAEPFLSRDQKSFTNRSAYGQRLPILPEFLAFLTDGAVGRHLLKKEYEVALEALPTDVNPEANAKPQSVIVEMTCSNGVQRIENYNFPVIRVFKWSPEACGDVKMTINFRDVSLTRTYMHYSGFPQFLAEFRTGIRVFTRADFPISSGELEKLNVDQIMVRMKLTNHEPLIELIERTPLGAPQKITACWE